MIDWSRSALEQHSTDMRQFFDFRKATLGDGQRVVEVYNSSGLTLTLLPDRGLDIWAAAYKGIPLTWISQSAPHRADWGRSWLALFNGGLLTTCGLQHVGPPEIDDQTGEQRDIHGQFTRLSAGSLALEGGWQADGRYVRSLSAEVAEAALFGAQLRLRRRYDLVLGEPAITLTDTVTNLADAPATLMVLYHVNLGYPLVREGAALATASAAVYPRDEPARRAYADWPVYHAAQVGHAEEVFYHHVRVGEDGRARAALVHGDLGLQLEWDTRSAPYLTQWKNFRQGMYVCGVEPGNCVPEGQNAARAAGRLEMLAPGESRTFTLTLRVLDGAAAVAGCRETIAHLARDGQPVAGCQLNEFA